LGKFFGQEKAEEVELIEAQIEMIDGPIEEEKLDGVD
jgi:hypothetical protein